MNAEERNQNSNIKLTESEWQWRDSTKKIFSTFDVWKWPELQALCRRLGVPLDRDIRVLTIQIGPHTEAPKITIEMHGREPIENTPTAVSTTTIHNVSRETKSPVTSEEPEFQVPGGRI